MGNVNVFSNGGRLQPGCYTDKNNINQLGYALKCSYDRGLELLRNSYEKDYKSRYLKLWMYFVCIWVLYLEHVDVGMSIDKADVQTNCQITWGKDQLSEKPRTLHFDILWERRKMENHWVILQILKDMALILFTNMIELVKMEMIHVIIISTSDINFRKIIWCNS